MPTFPFNWRGDRPLIRMMTSKDICRGVLIDGRASIRPGSDFEAERVQASVPDHTRINPGSPFETTGGAGQHPDDQRPSRRRRSPVTQADPLPRRAFRIRFLRLLPGDRRSRTGSHQDADRVRHVGWAVIGCASNHNPSRTRTGDSAANAGHKLFQAALSAVRVSLRVLIFGICASYRGTETQRCRSNASNSRASRINSAYRRDTEPRATPAASIMPKAAKPAFSCGVGQLPNRYVRILACHGVVTCLSTAS
jgi:hypothetical protein